MNVYVTIALGRSVINNVYMPANSEFLENRNNQAETDYRKYLLSLKGTYKDFAIVNLDASNQLRQSLHNCLKAQKRDLDDFLSGKISLHEPTILPPEFTSVYNIMKTYEADQVFMQKLGQNTLNVKLFLLSTDSSQGAASNYILERLLDKVTVKIGKLTAKLRIEHDTDGSDFVLKGILTDQETFSNDGLQYLFSTLDNISKIITKYEPKNAPKKNPVGTVSRKFIVIQGVAQFRPYLTIYALLKNIIAVTAPTKMNNLVMKPLPISFEIDKIDSYKFLLDSINSNIIQADDDITREMAYYGLIYQDNDNIYYRTPFGNILRNIEYENTAIGHIYEDHTVCSLLSNPKHGHCTINDKMLPGIKLYKLDEGQGDARFTTKPPNKQKEIYTDIDILIIKDYDKTINTNSYKAVFCECKSFGQIIKTHRDAYGNEVLDLLGDSSMRTQIKKAAALFSYINQPKDRRLQSEGPILSLIKYAVEYRIYIYALDRKSINDRIDDIAGKLHDIWVDNYKVAAPGFTVEFVVYHGILKDNLRDFVVNDVNFRQVIRMTSIS